MGTGRTIEGLAATLRRAARTILGRPPSDWAGPDPARVAARRALPAEIDNRHEVVCFPAAGDRGWTRDSVPLRRFVENGHRVFCPSPEGLCFESLDALRRDLGLGATVSILQGPQWRGLAERFRAERCWPVVENPSEDPEALTEAARQAFPRLSIVIVTYNNRDLTRLCVDSLFARTEWPNVEVLVVDNGSSDATPELLREFANRHPNLRVIAFDENRGFPAACNAGLAQASGAYLALLNNDTVLTRGWAAALSAHLARRPKLGMVGPVTNAIANEARIEIGYEDLADLPAWAASWTRAHDGEAFAIPMLAFFCVVLRREVFETVGPLDERFGLGMFEDGDYNRRVRDQGWEILCARDAFVHHWQKASFRRLGKAGYFELFEENRRKYEEKWGGR